MDDGQPTLDEMKQRIKNLDNATELVGSKLYLPRSVLKVNPLLKSPMIIKSGWNKGFWLVHKMTDSRMFPIGFDSLEEIAEWQVEV